MWRECNSAKAYRGRRRLSRLRPKQTGFFCSSPMSQPMTSPLPASPPLIGVHLHNYKHDFWDPGGGEGCPSIVHSWGALICTQVHVLHSSPKAMASSLGSQDRQKGSVLGIEHGLSAGQEDVQTVALHIRGDVWPPSIIGGCVKMGAAEWKSFKPAQICCGLVVSADMSWVCASNWNSVPNPGGCVRYSAHVQL